VIPRVRLSRHDRSWTELFKASQTLRTLRVMIDAELIEGLDPIGWTPENLLAGFLTHDDIELWRYHDGGPPPGTPALASRAGASYAIGWVVAKSATPGGLVTHDLVWCDGQAATHGGIVGNAVDVAASDTLTQAYQTLDPATASSRRTADAVAARAAEELKADLFITNREYLHRLTWSLAQGVTFCAPTDALALVSLYLRAQGDFLIWKDPNRKGVERFNKGLSYCRRPGSCSRLVGGGSRPASPTTTPRALMTSSISAAPSSSASPEFFNPATMSCVSSTGARATTPRRRL
jgi:hypothetical protein